MLLLASGEKGLLELIMATHAGMTTMNFRHCQRMGENSPTSHV